MKTTYHHLAIFFIVLLLQTACRRQPELPKAPEKKSKPLTVALLPYKNFDTALIGFIKTEITNFYINCDVVVMPEKNLPAFAYYKPRNRFKADSLLRYQKGFNIEGARSVVGLTASDISTKKSTNADWGVFGLGYCPGKSAVVSTYRLKRSSHSIEQFKQRLSKVVLHELGHNFGLPHCTTNKECLMNDAIGQIKQVDRERRWLCDNCRKLLSYQ